MYEQDYIIRMNNEVIRTMVKLLLNKDTGVPVNISEGTIKSENKKMLELANGQSGIDNIKKMEEEILTLVDANKEGALEKALVFYGYLNELTEDALLSKNYSHEKVKRGLKMIAERYGFANRIWYLTGSFAQTGNGIIEATWRNTLCFTPCSIC